MGNNSKGKPKTYAIRKEELDQIIEQAAVAGIDAFRNEEKKARNKIVNRNLHNVRKLLESYRTLKNDLLHSDYETEEAQQELRFKCVEDLMSPGDVSMDELMAKEISRLQENAWRKRQIERAIELLKEDCSKPGEPEAMRKYRVIIGLYIQDEKLDYADLAERENVVERTIYRDASDACKMLAPYLFSVDAIIN